MSAVCYEVYLFYRNNSNISAFLPTLRCSLTLYLQPCICAIGLILNILCLAIFYKVLCRRKVGAASALVPYLTALTTFDAIQLLLSVPILVFSSAIRYKELFGQYNVAVGNTVNLSIFLFAPVMLTANSASNWLITMICIQRFVAVCHPMLNRTLGFMRRNKSIISCITLVALAVNIVHWFNYTLEREGDMFYLLPTSLKQNVGYIFVYEGLIYSLTAYIIPFLTLVILSFRIIRAIRRAEVYRTQMSHSEQQENRSTKMILTVVGVFMACHTLSIIIRWWEYVDTSIYAPESTPAHPALLLTDLSNILVNINSAANPLIYFMCSRRFRDLLSNGRKTSGTANCTTALSMVSSPVPRPLSTAGQDRSRTRIRGRAEASREQNRVQSSQISTESAEDFRVEKGCLLRDQDPLPLPEANPDWGRDCSCSFSAASTSL